MIFPEVRIRKKAEIGKVDKSRVKVSFSHAAQKCPEQAVTVLGINT